MASFSGESLLLAGFTLAHAVWSVSDTTEEELLCPLALVDTAGERRLVRFESDTQEEALALMADASQEYRERGDSFAAAREGLWRPDGETPEDIVTVEFWAPGMDAPSAVLQPFRRADQDRSFVLLAAPILVADGRIIPPDAAAPALEILMAGVLSHEAVEPLWKGWQPA